MRPRIHEWMVTLFSFFTATCFTITVFAVPFYLFGISAEAAFRISTTWLVVSIPFGCAVGRHLRQRNTFIPCAYTFSITEK